MVSSEVLIKANNLTKKFGNFTAVDHIDFEVYKGECVGFLGPNGAGKTTTVRMIYCFLPLIHVVNLTRGLVLGRTEVFLLLSLVWIVVVTLVFFVLSINLMKKRLIK